MGIVTVYGNNVVSLHPNNLCMEDRVVLVAHKQSAFARHINLLGFALKEIKESAKKDNGWAAVYWDQASMSDFVERNKIVSHLLNTPVGCTRILDFNINGIGTTKERLIRESLTYCDLLRIGKEELSALCHLLGIATNSLFDSCFELMARFSIKTLIVSHGNFGSHVFHGNAVSEKWGHLSFGVCSKEEAERAFLAAYFAASQGPESVFTDYHKQALEYLKRVCRP